MHISIDEGRRKQKEGRMKKKGGARKSENLKSGTHTSMSWAPFT